MAFQLRRAGKSHRAQALRLKRKKKSLFIYQAWKFCTFVTNMFLLLLTEFRSATIANAAASPASLPFWPRQASGALKVSSPEFLEAPGEGNFLHPLTSLQPRIILTWVMGKPHNHSSIPERGACSATERQIKAFYLKKVLFYYLLPQNTEI